MRDSGLQLPFPEIDWDMCLCFMSLLDAYGGADIVPQRQPFRSKANAQHRPGRRNGSSNERPPGAAANLEKRIYNSRAGRWVPLPRSWG